MKMHFCSFTYDSFSCSVVISNLDGSRLDFFRYEYGFAKVYEGSVGIFSSWNRLIYIATKSPDVDHFHNIRISLWSFDSPKLSYNNPSKENVHNSWCVIIIKRPHFHPVIKMFFFSIVSASVPPAIFIVAASYAGCNKTLVVFWFILALGFMGFYYCSLKIHSLDLSPNYAGPIAALTNGAGSITGVGMFIHSLKSIMGIFNILFISDFIKDDFFVHFNDLNLCFCSCASFCWNDDSRSEL